MARLRKTGPSCPSGCVGDEMTGVAPLRHRLPHPRQGARPPAAASPTDDLHLVLLMNVKDRRRNSALVSKTLPCLPTAPAELQFRPIPLLEERAYGVSSLHPRSRPR